MTSDVFLFHVFYRQKMRIYFWCGKTHDNCQEHIRCQLNLKSLFWPDGVRHLWSMMKASSGDNWKGRPLLRSCSNVLSIAFNTERSNVKRFLLTSYCLSSSQTWVIFLPNRNFYEKSKVNIMAFWVPQSQKYKWRILKIFHYFRKTLFD